MFEVSPVVNREANTPISRHNTQAFTVAAGYYLPNRSEAPEMVSGIVRHRTIPAMASECRDAMPRDAAMACRWWLEILRDTPTGTQHELEE